MTGRSAPVKDAKQTLDHLREPLADVALRRPCHAAWMGVPTVARSVSPVAAGGVLVIGCAAHARKPLGRARHPQSVQNILTRAAA
jgi:hypothetical protein